VTPATAGTQDAVVGRTRRRWDVVWDAVRTRWIKTRGGRVPLVHARVGWDRGFAADGLEDVWSTAQDERRVRRVILIALLAVLAATGSGSAQAARWASSGKAPPTKAQQLQAYLTAVRPLAIKVRVTQLQETRRVNAVIEAFDRDPDLVVLHALCRQLGLASGALNVIKRPAFLAEPHAVLVAAWRSEAIACARFIDEVQTALPWDEAVPVEHLVDATRAGLYDERHWRGEVIAQLRRLGLVVPSWVQQVGR
jgi:hypothetical protein